MNATEIAAVIRANRGGRTGDERTAHRWLRRPGQAREISIGADGTVWTLGREPAACGFAVQRWRGDGWEEAVGGAIRIAAGPFGDLWTVDSRNRIHRITGAGREEMPGRAGDIAVGADGSVWAIGDRPASGGNTILQWRGSGWAEVPGGARRIAVAPDGVPWVVDDEQRILRRSGSVWREMPGRGLDIAFGGEGSRWLLGTGETHGGSSIHEWVEREGWRRVPGGATSISVGPGGDPWITDSSGDLYERRPPTRG